MTQASEPWKDVISMIAEGAEISRVAEATTHAWNKAFNAVREDTGFREAVWLISQIGVAGKSGDPSAKLSAAGVEIQNASSMAEVAVALMDAMDHRLQNSRQRSDFGELAQRALVGAVTEHLQKLLQTTAGDVAAAITKCGKAKEFAALSTRFFSRLTNECLDYFLSKTVPAQVGEGRRFATTTQFDAFQSALQKHCAEASRIVTKFSADWFSKNLKEGGGAIDRDAAEKFGWYGMEKVRQELSARAKKDAKSISSSPRHDKVTLLAERTELKHLLDQIPQEDVIDRLGIDSRLKAVEATLGANLELSREPARNSLPMNRVFATIEIVASQVAARYGITFGQLTAKTPGSREHKRSWPRQVAAYVCFNDTTATVQDIAKLLHRDHTTIRYAIKHVRQLVESYPTVAHEVNEFRRQLKKPAANDGFDRAWTNLPESDRVMCHEQKGFIRLGWEMRTKSDAKGNF